MEKDLLKRMWEMQRQLNRETFKKNNLTDYDEICHISKDGTPNEYIRYLPEKWVQNYVLAIRQECSELMDSTNWKWWRTKVDLFDIQNIRVELVDIWHFLMSACQVMGMEPEDLFRMYMAKNRVNFQRQESGYLEKDPNDCSHIK